MSPFPPSFNSNSVCIHTRYLLLTTHHPLPTSPRPLFSCTYKSLYQPDRFAGPLFPHTYKSLFPEPLSFHIYTKPPGVTPPGPRSACATSPRTLRLSVIICRSGVKRFLTPFPATHTKNAPKSHLLAPVTPFAATHAKMPSRKSFPCHTYKKVGVGSSYG